MRTYLFAIVVITHVASCDEADDRPARWSYLYPAVVQPSCATAACHSKMTALAGVDLSTAEGAYAVLTGHICGEPVRPSDPPGNYVFPHAPERSKLIYLLRGDDVDVMPPDVPLPEVEIEVFERWILEGASCE